MTKFEEEFEKFKLTAGASPKHKKIINHFKDWQPQQSLPVVPECVAVAIEKDTQANVSISDVFEATFSYENHHLTEAGLWTKNNPEEYIVARNIGYTVEKPQQKRYEVKLLSGESMHFNPIGNPKNIKDYRFSFGNYAGWKTQFTKSELAEIKDGMFYKILNQKSFTAPTAVSEDWIWSDELQAYEWKNPFIELMPVGDGE